MRLTKTSALNSRSDQKKKKPVKIRNHESKMQLYFKV